MGFSFQIHPGLDFSKLLGILNSCLLFCIICGFIQQIYIGDQNWRNWPSTMVSLWPIFARTTMPTPFCGISSCCSDRLEQSCLPPFKRFPLKNFGEMLFPFKLKSSSPHIFCSSVWFSREYFCLSLPIGKIILQRELLKSTWTRVT